MKHFRCCILFIFLSCSHGAKNDAGKTSNPSKGEFFLHTLEDSLQSEFLAASTDVAKDAVLKKYHDQLQDYLMVHKLDSINVVVDTVIVNGLSVTTRFHHDRIQFQYCLTFMKDMPARDDSVFNFMKNLRTGSDTSVNFNLAGSCQVNNPVSGELPVIRIFAFPAPLSFTSKGSDR